MVAAAAAACGGGWWWGRQVGCIACWVHGGAGELWSVGLRAAPTSCHTPQLEDTRVCPGKGEERNLSFVERGVLTVPYAALKPPSFCLVASNLSSGVRGLRTSTTKSQNCSWSLLSRTTRRVDWLLNDEGVCSRTCSTSSLILESEMGASLLSW